MEEGVLGMMSAGTRGWGGCEEPQCQAKASVLVFEVVWGQVTVRQRGLLT